MLLLAALMTVSMGPRIIQTVVSGEHGPFFPGRSTQQPRPRTQAMTGGAPKTFELFLMCLCGDLHSIWSSGLVFCGVLTSPFGVKTGIFRK